MVVGVRALLQEGRTYSYGDLQSAFGLDEDQFPLAFDTLVRTRRIRLVIFDRGFAAPVSYTHLDVYKRQHRHASIAIGPRVRYSSVMRKGLPNRQPLVHR